MLQTATWYDELAGFDPFQASRALEFRVSPFVKDRRASIHAANGVLRLRNSRIRPFPDM